MEVCFQCFNKALTSYKLYLLKPRLKSELLDLSRCTQMLQGTDDPCGYLQSQQKIWSKKNDEWFHGMEGESNKNVSWIPAILNSSLPYSFFLAEGILHFPINLSEIVLKTKDTHSLFFQIWLWWRGHKKPAHYLKEITRGGGGTTTKNADRERRQNKMYLCSRRAIQQLGFC